jgi:hypothetical protein
MVKPEVLINEGKTAFLSYLLGLSIHKYNYRTELSPLDLEVLCMGYLLILQGNKYFTCKLLVNALRAQLNNTQLSFKYLLVNDYITLVRDSKLIRKHNATVTKTSKQYVISEKGEKLLKKLFRESKQRLESF